MKGMRGMNIEDPTVGRVLKLIADRSAAGIVKYGMTIHANPLKMREWLQHSLEELLDAAIYTQRMIDNIDEDLDALELGGMVKGKVS